MRENGLFQQNSKQALRPLVEQAVLLGRQYDAVVANPPYMGRKGINPSIKLFLEDNYSNSKNDLY